MTAATRTRVRDGMSHVRRSGITSSTDRKTYVGLLFTMLAILLVIALLALSAAFTSLQIPGTPIWYDFPAEWPIV